MEFWTTLIKTNLRQTQSAEDFLDANCTRINDKYYIYEGDIDCLADAGVSYKVAAEGTVPSLGGKSKKKLVEICLESFGIDVTKE
jgi:hypothetical protein